MQGNKCREKDWQTFTRNLNSYEPLFACKFKQLDTDGGQIIEMKIKFRKQICNFINKMILHCKFSAESNNFLNKT